MHVGRVIQNISGFSAEERPEQCVSNGSKTLDPNYPRDIYVGPQSAKLRPPQTEQEAENRAAALREALREIRPEMKGIKVEVRHHGDSWRGFYYLEITFPRKIKVEEISLMISDLDDYKGKTGIRSFKYGHSDGYTEKMYCFFTLEDSDKFIIRR